MDIKELREWAEMNNIIDRTIESFKKLLVNYETDNPEEFREIMKERNKEKLSYYVHTVSLNLGNWPECSYNTISACMRVYYDDKQIANYTAFYLFSGNEADDVVDFL